MGGGWKLHVFRQRRTGEAGVAGRLVASLFFALFFGLGAFFVVMIARETWRAAETYGWQERRCEITHSEVVRTGGDSPYEPRVAFRSLDAGPAVSGQHLGRLESSYGSHGEAAAQLAPYPTGAVVSCYASSQGEVVLRRGPLWMGLWLLLPLVFVAIGGIGLFATWKPRRRDPQGRPVPKPLSAQAASAGRGRGLWLFGLVFTAVGGVMAWFLTVVPLLQVHAARSWAPESCVVEHSSVVSHSSDDGTTYSVDILYRWDRGRGVERSSRYSFFGGSSSGHAGKAKLVRAYPRGAEVTCWVDPERSNEAVLERGPTTHALLAGIPILFLAIGVGLAVAGRRRMGRRRQMLRQTREGRGAFAADDPVLEVLPAFTLEPGPVKLESGSSPLGRLVGIACAALFWNGIVSVFVYQAWQGFQRERPEWFLVLFLVPFVLVGVALVFGVLHALLALHNGRPQLVASTRTPRLGERIDLQWTLPGRAERLDDLRITLVGSEHATYRIGTNTHTATETFLEQPIFEAQGGVRSGQASVSLPEDGMHSFESANNAVRWEIRLAGSIPRWPDLQETYPLVVLPPRGDARDRKEGR